MAEKKDPIHQTYFGRLIQRDITLQPITSQFGAPANDWPTQSSAREFA